MIPTIRYSRKGKTTEKVERSAVARRAGGTDEQVKHSIFRMVKLFCMIR